MTASILVVDDEPAIQDILTWALSAEGYRVATAGSGEEALSRVEQEDFDVIPILADVGGWGVARKTFGDTKLHDLLHEFNEAIAA